MGDQVPGPKVPRIKMLKASTGVEMEREIPIPS